MSGFASVFRFCVKCLAGVVGLAAILFGYFVYTPSPAMPHLSGTLTRASVDVGGLSRTYLTYVPRGAGRGSPVVLVLHGAGESGAQIRIETGYGFDRIADEQHFVVYPNAFKGYWNACWTREDVSENQIPPDDVEFLGEVVRKLVREVGVDPLRAFAAGSSRGGFMAFRLALEAPSRFRAVAAVSANLHTPDNFKCNPSRAGTSSVLIMNGTEDLWFRSMGARSVFSDFRTNTGR